MKFAQDLISTHEEPKSEPVAYASPGNDLDGTPIESGLGFAVWHFSVMPQADYDTLLDLQGDVPGVRMYVRTSKRNGASGIDFENYSAIVGRPAFASREGLLVYDVTIPLTLMIVA